MTPVEALERGQHAGCVLPGGNGKPGREQRVAGLIGADQRQADVILLARVRDAQALREPVARHRGEPQRFAPRADGEHGAARAPGGGDHLRGVLGIRVDDGNAARGQQLREQPQLGREIGLHGRVIVEVIAAEVGEGCSLQPHAVEPVLVEAVRGRLEGQVRDALARQLGQSLVQADGVRRGQPAVDAAVGLDEADGAERGGRVAEGRKHLARELRHRRLAAGAGDGDHRCRLGRIEARRHQRQRPAGLRSPEHHHTRGYRDVGSHLGEDGGSALGDGFGHEAGPIGLGARNGGEQPAWLHLATVRGDAEDVDGPDGRGRRYLRANQGLELHCPSFVVVVRGPSVGRRLGRAPRRPHTRRLPLAASCLVLRAPQPTRCAMRRRGACGPENCRKSGPAQQNSAGPQPGAA